MCFMLTFRLFVSWFRSSGAAPNLNQVAIQANTYGAIYPEELEALQRDYAALWEPLSDLLKQLSALVEL